jgi:uncharacterized Zn-finger protein
MPCRIYPIQPRINAAGRWRWLAAADRLPYESWGFTDMVPRARRAAAIGARKAPPTDRIIMADSYVPHFHNTPGVPVIEIGAREFMCVGELPPFDHPHVYLDMGDAIEIICPYCSTLYRLDPALAAHEARPSECALMEAAAP